MAKANTRDIRWGDGYVTERLLKSGDRVFQARWKEPHPTRGIIWRSKNFRDEDLAYDHLREVGRKKRKGTYAPESTMTLSEAVVEYAESRLELKRWTQNTYVTNKVFMQRLIDPQIGTLRVTRLTAQALQRWADDLTKEKSPTTVRSTLSIIRGALRRQLRFGVIQSNPADYIEVRARDTEEAVPWSVDEIRRILAHTEQDDMMHLFYLIGFGTGMRPGELRALRWGDIDWDRSLVNVQRTITKDTEGKEIVGTTTKTGKSREIVIGAALVDALRKWKSIQNERRLMAREWLDTMVFDRGDGRFLPATTLTRKHNAVIAAAGVLKAGPHNIRHTTQTLEDEFGTSLGVSKARRGHARTETTSRYTHAQIAAQANVADHLSEVITGQNTDESSALG